VINWLDVILVIFLILATFLGLKGGLARTIPPVIGLIVGVAVAGRYYDALAHLFHHSRSIPTYAMAFAIIVVVFLISLSPRRAV